MALSAQVRVWGRGRGVAARASLHRRGARCLEQRAANVCAAPRPGRHGLGGPQLRAWIYNHEETNVSATDGDARGRECSHRHPHFKMR